MHQGHREAALGNDRPQERQMRLEREILMQRSIDAAPQGAAGTAGLMEGPGAGLRAGSRDGGSAPGKDSSLLGKPRNSDESFHTHNTHLADQASSLTATPVPSSSKREIQIARKAASIRAKRPTAMIVLVVVSIAPALVRQVVEIDDRLADALRRSSTFHVPTA